MKEVLNALNDPPKMVHRSTLTSKCYFYIIMVCLLYPKIRKA